MSDLHNITSWLPAILAVVGGGGLAWVFKFQREDAGKAVENIAGAMNVMRLLNEDLSKQFIRVVDERDTAHDLLSQCVKERSSLEQKLRRRNA